MNGKEICNICGNERTVAKTTDHKYNYESVSDTRHSRKCSVCGKTPGNEDHKFNSNNVCSLCGFKKVDHEHKYDKVLEEPTCTKTGKKQCTICNNVKATASLGHDIEYKSTGDDEHSKKCKRCGQDLGTELHRFGIDEKCRFCGEKKDGACDHNFEIVKEPDCYGVGNKRCTKCGALQSYGQPGHIIEYKKVDSKLHSRYCSRCNKDLGNASHDFTAKGVCTLCGYDNGKIHTHTYEVQKEPTCTESGIRACTTCSSTWTIEPLGHKYTYTSIDANNHEVSCTRCNTYVKTEAHKMSSGKCELCGNDKTTQTGTSSNPTHTHDNMMLTTIIVRQKATCTQEGIKECATCHEIIYTLTLGHDIRYDIVDAAQHSRICSICKEDLGNEDHDFDSKNVCKICGYKLDYYHKHVYDSSGVCPCGAKKPQSSGGSSGGSTGSSGSSECKHESTSVVAKYLDDEKHENITICNNCKKELSKEEVVHNIVDTKYTNSAVKSKHTKIMTCSECGEFTIDEAHIFENEVCVCGMNINDAGLLSIKFAKDSYTFSVGEVVEFKTLLQIKPANTNYTFKWSVSDGEAIKLMNNGRGVMKAEAYKVIVTVTEEGSGLSAETFVIINKGNGDIAIPGEPFIEPDNGDTFSDVVGESFQKDVDRVVKEGILGGVTGTNFMPDSRITRSTFITALARLDNAKVTGYANLYKDVSEEADYRDCVAWATAMRIIAPDENGNFNPESFITREEMAVIIYKYFKASHSYLLKDEKFEGLTFADSSSISENALNAVYTITKLQIMSANSEGNFDPTTNVSRAEAATILSKILDCTSADISSGSSGSNPNTNQNTNPNVLPDGAIDTARYYTPSDFGQDKPIMDKNSYTEEDFLRMEAELRERVEEAGFGTRAGTVAAALYLASLDYAVPYRGTPMDRENYQGTYNKLGMNREWGRYTALKRDISETYKKGWVGLNGLDCGAFVTWALVNGGVLPEGKAVGVSPKDFAYDTQPKKLSEVFDQIEPGDIMYTYGERNGTKTWTHVALIVGKDSENVYIAESTTGQLNKLVVSTIPKNTTSGKSWVTLADDKLYTAKNADGTENKGNVPIVWGRSTSSSTPSTTPPSTTTPSTITPSTTTPSTTTPSTTTPSTTTPSTTTPTVTPSTDPSIPSIKDQLGTNNVTEGMFVTALAKIDKAQLGGVSTMFDEIKDDDYYKESVNWAISSGIVNGLKEPFSADRIITKQEVANIIYEYVKKYHAYMLAEASTNPADTDALRLKIRFKDAGNIPGWVMESVYATAELGIVEYTGGESYSPSKKLTQLEVVRILTRLGEKIRRSDGKLSIPDTTGVVDTGRYYTPSDFGQGKPMISKDTYSETDYVRMEAELKARVEEAGFGTRAGAVAAALYLASLDYAVPYRGTPMDLENDIGFYCKMGMNRTWGKSVALKKAVGNYEKGWTGINGMDCTGFASWTMVNGGVVPVGSGVGPGTKQFNKESKAYRISEVFDQIQAGDIVLTYAERNGEMTWTHIAIVVGKDANNVYIAESTTGQLNKLVVSTIPKNTTSAKGWVVLTDDTLYKAKNPDGTERKGNIPVIWK